jgi:hypothetical protein
MASFPLRAGSPGFAAVIPEVGVVRQTRLRPWGDANNPVYTG